MPPAPNPAGRKSASTHNLKLLLTTLSITTTVSGWAMIALNAPASADQSADDPNTAELQPTPLPTPTQAPEPAQPQVVIPPLSSLPVRGLREVGQPAASVSAPGLVFVQPPAPAVSGGGGGGRPAPAPRPAPVSKSKGSH
ncbi:MAG: hypothetical protein ACM3JD_10535 [Rudaea sp.]